ncbi:cytochrome P450 [Streptomyces sp. AN091965]|uniref:cytochrome P450 n=1 Tax=Streptomyces sp. AN091965 TaxID=2927803 RepID=UPI001F611921|nr:cytochrome P450 [Streptomyces sp. AN091965]MCI3935365.1 cytochrome P450 [Streptomyces sp. AN091965]
MTQAAPFPQDRTCPYHPPAGYRPLSEQGPLSRITLYDDTEAWVVTGHAEAQALLTDARLSANRQNPAFPSIAPRFELSRRVRTALLGVDDPEHNRQRRMLIPPFGVKRVAAMRPRIEHLVDQLLDTMLEQGPPVDLVSAFALPVPSMVICELLGVPYDDHDFFEEASRRLLRGKTADEAEEARLDLMDYLVGLVDRKSRAAGGRPADAAAPTEGLLDDLVRERLHTDEVDRDELARIALILLVAGHETTANMISLGTFTLLEHPAQLDALRAEPELIRDAVEELLRFLSIADALQRVATADIEVAGQTIRAGEGVFLAASAINRDAAVYPEPDDLDVRRSARHHLAFGFGIHQCLGQNLARLELEIAFTSLLARVPDLRLAVPPDEVPIKPGDTIQGLIELPVSWGRG